MTQPVQRITQPAHAGYRRSAQGPARLSRNRRIYPPAVPLRSWLQHPSRRKRVPKLQLRDPRCHAGDDWQRDADRSAVQIYAADHPRDAAERRSGVELG
jgi:hypothetical protein